MANQPKIFLSPFVLSTVMFDNSNSLGDQEGFLIGSTQKSVRREISDQSMFNTEEDLLISVYSCIPCGDFLSFYDNVGTVNPTKIHDLLGERSNSIVGWYRFRRNLVAYPSAREMRVHEGLEKLFPGNIAFGAEYFVFGVFGSSCFPTVATHTYDYAFFVQMSDSFKSLSINLLNLGDTKTEYRMDSISSAFVNSATFDSVLSVPWDFGSSWQAEDVMQQMHKMLREKCDNLAEELTASESVNNAIEQEIYHLSGELQRLTSQESGKVSQTDLEKIESHEKQLAFGKRPINESYMEDIPHPIYGKYFPQNRPQDPNIVNKDIMAFQATSRAPPSKKIKVVSHDRNRMIDHDYSGASDDETSSCTSSHIDKDSTSTRSGRCMIAGDHPPKDTEVQCNQTKTVLEQTKANTSHCSPLVKDSQTESELKVKSTFVGENAQSTSPSNVTECTEIKTDAVNMDNFEKSTAKTLHAVPTSSKDNSVENGDYRLSH